MIWDEKKTPQKTNTITLIFPYPYSEEHNSPMELFFTFSDEKVSCVCLYKTRHAVDYYWCCYVVARLLPTGPSEITPVPSSSSGKFG